MKGVILAGGKATRMGTFCGEVHKTMLKLCGKPLLQWNMENLPVDEFVIIVGYRKHDIMNYFGEKFQGKKITYVEQKEQNGTGHALQQVDRIDERFIFINGDDWYADGIRELCRKKIGILGQRVEKNAEKFGVLQVENGYLKGIQEKPKGVKQGLVNTGCYVLDGRIFDELKKVKKSARGEIEVTDAVMSLAKKGKLSVVECTGWMGLAYLWELLDATKLVMERCDMKILGRVHSKTIKGGINLGKNSEILPGVRIEGPVFIGEDCKIGPNCYIRGATIIGDRCRVGQSVEIKNSIIMDGTNVSHLSYVGDSVIGLDCNLGAGTKIANLRFDDSTIRCEVKDARVDTGRRKLGVMMGHNVKTGINVSIYPGVQIGSNSMIGPGVIVSRDVGDRKLVLANQKQNVTEDLE